MDKQREIKAVRVRFQKVVQETTKSYLLLVHGTEIWFPRKLCWNFAPKKCHVVIPAWLYKDRFGIDPSTADETEIEPVDIVEYHEPAIISAVENNELEELRYGLA